MSLKNVTTPEANARLIEFSCDRAAFDAAVTAVYKRKVGKMSVAGFRPGKAPQPLIEKYYGKGIFYEDAVNDLIPQLYPEALKETGLEPINQPEFDIVELNDEGLTLSAKFYVKPEIEIEGYKGISVKKQTNEVSDDEVEHEISHARENAARETEVTGRPAAMGDTVVLDYSGSVDGVKFEGGTAEKQTLELGSNSFIPGFEEQVAGKNVDEEFTVSVTFPEEYHAEELAGKAAEFVCTIHSIAKKELPELDDAFAADVSEFDTLEEYRADVKKNLAEKKEKDAEREIDNQIDDALAAAVKGDIPQVMFDQETERQMQSFENRLSSQGLNLDMYCQFTGMTKDDMISQIKPNAEKQVKVRLALEKIAALEDVQATEDEISAKYQSLADAYKMEFDAVKSAIGENAVIEEIKLDKAYKLVKDSVVYTEEEKAAE